MDITAYHHRLARWPRRLGALCLTFGLSLTAAPALSQAVDFDSPDSGSPGLLAIRWDGPTTHLAWNGRRYASAQSSFVGEPVAVPGDHSSRTALLRNDGPADAIATVSIQASSFDVSGPHGTTNTELKDLVHLTWNVAGTVGDATWGDIIRRGGGIEAIQVPVAKGQEFPITMGSYFPFDATTGRSQGAPSEVLAFTVLVQLAGDTSPPSPPAPSPFPLPTTGAAITPQHLVWGGLLIAGGLALILRARRQRSATPV